MSKAERRTTKEQEISAQEPRMTKCRCAHTRKRNVDGCVMRNGARVQWGARYSQILYVTICCTSVIDEGDLVSSSLDRDSYLGLLTDSTSAIADLCVERDMKNGRSPMEEFCESTTSIIERRGDPRYSLFARELQPPQVCLMLKEAASQEQAGV